MSHWWFDPSGAHYTKPELKRAFGTTAGRSASGSRPAVSVWVRHRLSARVIKPFRGSHLKTIKPVCVGGQGDHRIRMAQSFGDRFRMLALGDQHCGWECRRSWLCRGRMAFLFARDNQQWPWMAAEICPCTPPIASSFRCPAGRTVPAHPAPGVRSQRRRGAE